MLKEEELDRESKQVPKPTAREIYEERVASQASFEAFANSLLEFFIANGRSPGPDKPRPIQKSLQLKTKLKADEKPAFSSEYLELQLPKEPLRLERCLAVLQSKTKLRKVLSDQIAKRYLREVAGSNSHKEAFEKIGFRDADVKKIFAGGSQDVQRLAKQYLQVLIAESIVKKDLQNYEHINKVLGEKNLPLFQMYPTHFIPSKNEFLRDTIDLVLPEIKEARATKDMKLKIMDAIKSEIHIRHGSGGGLSLEQVSEGIAMHAIFRARKLTEVEQVQWMIYVQKCFGTWENAISATYELIKAASKRKKT